MLQSIEGDKGPAPPYPVLRGFLADFMLPTKTIRSLKLSTVLCSGSVEELIE